MTVAFVMRTLARVGVGAECVEQAATEIERRIAMR